MVMVRAPRSIVPLRADTATRRYPLFVLLSAVLAVLRQVAGELLETLPTTTEECGPFLAGMVWAFVLFWSCLLWVTWAHCSAHGYC